MFKPVIGDGGIGDDMRGSLPEGKLKEIEARLPRIDKDLLLAKELGFGVDLYDLNEGGSLGVALVCLRDAVNRFIQARMALHEAYACQVWYLEESPKASLDFEAALTGRFYADYVSLILYAAAEDIALFILHFLGAKQDYEAYLRDPVVEKKLRRKSILSKASKVGNYLEDRHPSDEITRIVRALRTDQEWDEAMRYRNTWVHEQPPLLEELGIQYARESRVQEVEGGRRIYFGQGSLPQYSVNELLNVMHSATDAFAEALSSLLGVVIRKREELGEAFDFEGRTISFGMR